VLDFAKARDACFVEEEELAANEEARANGTGGGSVFSFL
jgi:hypothetical protein